MATFERCLGHKRPTVPRIRQERNACQGDKKTAIIELADDFRDFLIGLADANADFALIGGYAVAFYGHVRATKDLDLVDVEALTKIAEKPT